MPETASTVAGLDQALVKEIVGRILAVARPQRILLFGSRARGDADSKSDIDLAVAGAQMTREEWLRLVGALESVDTLLPIQTVRLEDVPERLRERIAREGIELYAAPEAHG